MSSFRRARATRGRSRPIASSSCLGARAADHEDIERCAECPRDFECNRTPPSAIARHDDLWSNLENHAREMARESNGRLHAIREAASEELERISGGELHMGGFRKQAAFQTVVLRPEIARWAS